ncbi:cation transporter [Rugamonas sp. A1-17]|nr:cation transporter [Rugamonas sp. A1-17]
MTQHSTQTASVYHRSTFLVSQMDCPSEENLIRMALQGLKGVTSLEFDLDKRRLQVVHTEPSEALLQRLSPLNLGASLVESAPCEVDPDEGLDPAANASDARVLRLLLAVNSIMFMVEFIWGWIAQSTGLVADSLDMFADAAVYALSLYAVSRDASMKVRAAHIAGWLQLALAGGALVEVVRRAMYGSEPASMLMMGIGSVALVANAACLVLIAKRRDRGVHMTASYIFTANDVLANLGVVVAGLLVWWTGSPYPDLIIGTVIALLVMNGARRILRLR